MKHSNPSFLRTLLLLGSMVTGLLFPQLYVLRPILPYALGGMLFLAFFGVQASGFSWRIAIIPLINWSLGAILWYTLSPWNPYVALAALLIAITPTAAAATAVISFLHGNAAFVAASMVVTNISAALLIPLLLPTLVGQKLEITILPLLGSTMAVICIPFLCAKLLQIFSPRTASMCHRHRGISFYIWMCALCVVVANASHFLREYSRTGTALYEAGLMVATAVVMCIINFSLGYAAGGHSLRRETSQSIGQKNTILTIWIALSAFHNPLVALAPAFYVLCHNFYNAWQLSRPHSSPQ